MRAADEALSATTPRPTPLAWLVATCVLLLGVVLWHAWHSDDAYILLRSVDHLVRSPGHAVSTLRPC